MNCNRWQDTFLAPAQCRCMAMPSSHLLYISCKTVQCFTDLRLVRRWRNWKRRQFKCCVCCLCWLDCWSSHLTYFTLLPTFPSLETHMPISSVSGPSFTFVRCFYAPLYTTPFHNITKLIKFPTQPKINWYKI